MSTSIQVKSQLSHGRYSAVGTELPEVNDSFCAACARGTEAAIASARACNQPPGLTDVLHY